MPLTYLFPRIAAEGSVEALKKWSSTYAGIESNELASINEGRTLSDVLVREAHNYRQNNMSLPTPALLAIGGQAPRKYYPIAELVADNFPENKPIALQILIEQGPKKENADSQDPYLEPITTKGGIMMEVRDTAYNIAVYGEQGLQQTFDEIDAAYRAGQAAPQAAPPPPPPPAAHAAAATSKKG
jgi:hypothetical protein